MNNAKQQSAQAKPKQESVRFNARVLLRCASIVLLCAGIVFGTVLAAFSVRGELLQKRIPYVFGGQVQRECVYTIDIDDAAVRERVRNTKRHGQKSAFTYFCNDHLYMPSANEYGAILFGNPADNDCMLVLTVTDMEDRVLYRSGGVVPGKYITMIRPSMSDKDGSYPCRVYVSGYVQAERGYACVGTQYSALTVEIGGAQ